jgi:sarcosine oxidase subunit gamma
MPAEAPIRRSPLQHRVPLEAAGALRMAEQPFLGKFVIRGEPRAVDARIRQAFGLGVPFDPLTVSAARETAILWLGPDEWMVVTAAAEAEERGARLARALAGAHHQIATVSDYYTIIEIAGPRAREALMKLTTLDLHPRAFKAGMVAGSNFGRTLAILWQVRDDAAEGGPLFRLIVRWSMADYLWCLVARAGREWGLPVEIPVGGEKLTID